MCCVVVKKVERGSSVAARERKKVLPERKDVRRGPRVHFKKVLVYVYASPARSDGLQDVHVRVRCGCVCARVNEASCMCTVRPRHTIRSLFKGRDFVTSETAPAVVKTLEKDGGWCAHQHPRTARRVAHGERANMRSQSAHEYECYCQRQSVGVTDTKKTRLFVSSEHSTAAAASVRFRTARTIILPLPRGPDLKDPKHKEIL